eukprot:scaffold144302_cov20-Tisochrysis_lutea.AAC.2
MSGAHLTRVADTCRATSDTRSAHLTYEWHTRAEPCLTHEWHNHEAMFDASGACTWQWQRSWSTQSARGVWHSKCMSTARTTAADPGRAALMEPSVTAMCSQGKDWL